MALADRIIGVESGGNSNARNPNSSASGPGQFIDSTWLATVRAHRPDLAGQSDASLLALKSDPDLSREMTAAYASDNAGILRQHGLAVTPGTTYLAHFAGPQGAVGILSADPSTAVGSVLGPAVLKANPFLTKMSAGDLAAWADRKMGGSGSPAPMSIAGPQAGVSSAPAAPATSQAAPQQAAQAAPAARSAPAPLSAEAIAQLAAVPQLKNILPQRPNYFGLQTAPFSLGA